MTNTSRTEEIKRECTACGGTGQLSYFKGVSRFLLSVEECPVCAGLGFVVGPEDDTEEKDCRKK